MVGGVDMNIRNPKHDRQGVRKASDIEQKYDLSALGNLTASSEQQHKEMNRYNQAMNEVLARMKALEEKVIFPIGSIYVSLIADNPKLAFGGVWELIAEGYILLGVDPNSEIPEAFYGNEKCYVWKRVS